MSKPNDKAIAHESAALHVTGKAVYVDDIVEPQGLLHAAVGGSEYAHARITAIDLSAVKESEGVAQVFTYQDIPGDDDIGPVFPGDKLFKDKEVEYVGEPIFAVAASSHHLAHQAVKKALIRYEPLEAILSIEDALAKQSQVRPTHQQKRGDAHQAISSAPHRLQHSLYIKGQEHVYIEGQVAMSCPTDEGGMVVYTSSQHPSEIQALVAKVLNLPLHLVTVEVRRMGGAFGGKETQAASTACMSALLSFILKRPVKYRMPRFDDMVMTGKRHDFKAHYDIGFDSQGKLKGCDITLAGKCGFSPDLSDAIIDRAMFHVDNGYYLENALVVGHRSKTHTVSNTAFRGFGGPQGILVAENMMESIARELKLDPFDVRKKNLYGLDKDNVTHYGQLVKQNQLHRIFDELEQSAAYRKRREQIQKFNQNNEIFKKGISITPVKFGISFTVKFLNQAGSLVNVYTDGSVLVNHSGTEMGQGLFTKVAAIVAREFEIDIDRVKSTATRTDKVPNTSPTAASAGADLNGQAAQIACQKIKARLIELASSHFKVDRKEIHFKDNYVHLGHKKIPFSELTKIAYLERVSLSATGFYKTPDIGYDRDKAWGRPFFYYAYGAACSEVIIDTLTGESKVLRVDILHDVGDSLNEAIDIGQIQGGFIQGMGWLTTEDLRWDDKGQIISNNLATYKIPTAADVPDIFNIHLLKHSANEEKTIYASKAVGEPPLMLAVSVWCAIKDAIASLADYQVNPPLNAPATGEEILKSIALTQAAWRREQRH